MRWFVIYTALFCMVGTLTHPRVFGQPLMKPAITQSKIDSLKTLLPNSLKTPEKVAIYEQLAWEHINIAQLDLARQYVDSITIISKRAKYKKGIQNAKFYRGVIARHKGDFSEASENLSKFVSFYERTGDSAQVARGLFHLGVVYVYLGKAENSLPIFYRIIKIYEHEGDYINIGKTLNSIGVLYRRMKRFDQAIAVLNNAISIADSLQKFDDQSTALNNLANVYHELGENRKALTLFKRALELDRKIGNELGVAYELANIGVIYNQFSQHDSALVFQLQSLKIREGYSQKYEMSVILKQVGHTYLYLKNYDLAEAYLFRSLQIAKEIKAIEVLRDVYDYLSDLYADKNDFKKALDYKDNFVSLNDSLVSIASARQMNELQTQYETEKKDHQIILLAKENELQEKETVRQATLKKSFIGGLTSLLVLAGLFIYMQRQRLANQKLLAAKNEEIKEVNFKRQLSELELKALRAQINPHFLFNCMNSINRMILNGETDNASRYLTKFSKLVRKILEYSEETAVALNEELMMLETYIQLEALRFKGKINYIIKVDKAIERESTYIPPMVLQPFVENAIWHGLMHKVSEEEGILEIALKVEGDKLVCIIEDNGVGREKAKTLQEGAVLKSKSLGMKITEERLRLLSKERLEQLVNITDLKDAMNFAMGTRVKISIPFHD